MNIGLRLFWIGLDAWFTVVNANWLYAAGAGRARISALIAAAGCVMWAYFFQRDVRRLRRERAA